MNNEEKLQRDIFGCPIIKGMPKPTFNVWKKFVEVQAKKIKGD